MNTVNIGIAGDFCPVERIEMLISTGHWQSYFEELREELLKNHLNIFNLECPLTTADTKIRKTGPHLKASPNSTKILQFLNCNLVATANNHFMDFGETGLNDTYEALKAADIEWLGSGYDDKEAGKPFIKRINGIDIAFINLAEHEWSTTDGNEPGCNPFDVINAHYTIKQIRSEVDFIIAIVHGGHEYYELPSPRMQKNYRFLIDIGVDAVVGHHTHVVSGFEIYNQKPIFYSLGNFCFDSRSKRTRDWHIGMILNIKLSKNQGLLFDYKFICQNDDNPGIDLLIGSEEEEMHRRIERLNVMIIDQELLKREFEKYCDRNSGKMLSRIEPYTSKYMIALNRRKLLPNLMGAKKKTLFTNLVRCESHREVLLHNLEKDSGD